MTVDQKEALLEVMTSDGWKSVIVLMEDLIARQGQGILTLDVKDERALAFAKAEYDGARKLRVNMEKVRTEYLKGEK